MAEYHCKISIVTGDALSGTLPKAKYRKIQKWLEQHQSEVMFAWNELHNSRPYKGLII